MPKRRLPTVSAELRRRVAEKLRECRHAMDNNYFDVPDYEIRYDLGGRTAGQAGCSIDRSTGDYYDHFIRINPVLLIENTEEMINDTVVHEFCHVIQHKHFPNSRSHGHEWQRLMRMCGVEPTRTHKMDVTNAVRQTGKIKRKFQYGCACRTDIIVSSVRHNKMQRGATYTCRMCHQPIKHIRALGQLQHAEAKMAAQTAAPAAAETTLPKPVRKPAATKRRRTGPTKSDKALAIVRKYFDEAPNRHWLINEIARECEMSQAGAQTYLYNAMKKLNRSFNPMKDMK